MRKERNITIKVINNSTRYNMLIEFFAKRYREKYTHQKS